MRSSANRFLHLHESRRPSYPENSLISMSFLQPIFLVALAAAAIPVLLHLLSLRKLKVVPFSTLSFLKELQRSRIRAVRIRQLILLLLRTLLVLLIVLAFARPALTGMVAPLLGGLPASDVCLLIDDSFSMSARNENGTLLRQAQEAARIILDGLTDADNVNVATFSSMRFRPGAGNALWTTPDQASDRISSVQLSPVHVSLEDALRGAAELMEDRASPHREIFVISDFQRGLVSSPPAQAAAFAENSTVTFIRTGEPRDENVSLRSADLVSSIVEVGVPAAFDIRVGNHSADAARSSNISLFLGTRRLDQRVQSIEGGQVADVRLQGAPERAGFQTGSIMLDGDNLDFDNTWWFALHIPKERRVLVIGSEQETFYTALALSASRSSGSTGLRVTQVSPDRLTAAQLKDHDVYILPDISYREDLLRTIREQVEQGTGVILLPPGTGSVPQAGRTVSGEIGIGRPAVRTTVAAKSFLTFGRVDLDHPLFEGMFGERSTDLQQPATSLESPQVFSIAPWQRRSGATNILSLSNGAAFLTEQQSGAGHILMFSVSFTTEWSTFPVSGLFVPLLHRSVAYVSGTRAFRPSFQPGDDITLALPASIGPDLRLRPPDGSEIPVQPVLLPTGPVFRTRDAIMPGIYGLFASGQEIDRFAVNIPPEESDPKEIDADGLLQFADGLGIADEHTRIISLTDELGATVVASRIGTELWPMLLVLALLTAIAESIVAATLRPTPQEGVNV